MIIIYDWFLKLKLYWHDYFRFDTYYTFGGYDYDGESCCVNDKETDEKNKIIITRQLAVCIYILKDAGGGIRKAHDRVLY